MANFHDYLMFWENKIKAKGELNISTHSDLDYFKFEFAKLDLQMIYIFKS